MKNKKNLLLLFIIILGVILTCCNARYSQDKHKNETKESMFVVVERSLQWDVVYNKETKVMYAVSNGAYGGGTFTMLCDKDGNPQLWQGNYD